MQINLVLSFFFRRKQNKKHKIVHQNDMHYAWQMKVFHFVRWWKILVYNIVAHVF